MKIVKEENGLYLFEPKIFHDERGYFFESFNAHALLSVGIAFDCKQANESLSVKHVFRGFHFQLEPFAQAKLIRVTSGAIIDLAIDLRPDSSSFGKVYSFLLNDKNKHQLFIPKGFGHGFLALEDRTIISYLVDNFYSSDHDSGINPQSVELKDILNISYDKLIISDKDKALPIWKR